MAFRTGAKVIVKRYLLFLLPMCLFATPTAAAIPPLVVDSIPVGRTPLGVGTIMFSDATTVFGAVGGTYAAVANSGDDSVSIFSLQFNSATRLYQVLPGTIVNGIPSPYAVVTCRTGLDTGSGDRVLVTSPSTNSVYVVRIPQGVVLGSIRVGPQPYAAGCFYSWPNTYRAVVSLADNTLAVINLDSFTVTARISHVWASRSYNGVALVGRTAWVAGTELDVVTEVDIETPEIIRQIPIRAPTSVFCCYSWRDQTGRSRGFMVTSARDHIVLGLQMDTLRTHFSIRNVPNPQDLAYLGLGIVTTVGGSDSIALTQTENVEIIPGFPGASAVAGWLSTDIFRMFSRPVILITSPSSNRLFIVQPAPGPQFEFSVTNATFTAAKNAPGSLATAFVNTGLSQDFVPNTLPLPTSLGGATLRIGGCLTFTDQRWTYSDVGSIPAPLLFVGRTQVNFQVPPSVQPGDRIPAQLELPGGRKLLGRLDVAPVSPGVFFVPAGTQMRPAVLNQDNSLNQPTNPAARGSIIQIFGTGAGATEPPLAPGEPAPISGPLVHTRFRPTVLIGGKPARVLFSGMAPGMVGVWQINTEIPQDVVPFPMVSLQIGPGPAEPSLVPTMGVTIAVE